MSSQEIIDKINNMTPKQVKKLKRKLAIISEQESDKDKYIQSMSKINRDILNEPMTI